MRRRAALRASLATVVAGAAITAAGQSADPHAAMPERPTAATHAYAVAPGWFELEAGVELDRLDDAHIFWTPTTLKVGLAHRLQVEVSSAWLLQSGAERASGVSGLSVALKWKVADSLPLLGAFAVQPSLRLPTGAAVVGGNTTLGTALFISSHDLGAVDLDVNFGLTARLSDRGAAPPAATFWAVSSGIQVTGALGWVAECFGFPGTAGVFGAAPTVAFLTGPTFTAHEWIVLDLGVIAPLAGPQVRAAYAGVTWNIGRAWRASGGSAAGGARPSAPSP